MILINAIKNFKKSKRILFTTPGHCRGNVIPENLEKLLGNKVFSADLSEIDDFDNIRHPESLFLESQQKSAEIYDSKCSFYLFNGSTSGILALMLATIKSGDKVLIARNAHVSVYNALVLSGAIPVWMNCDQLYEWGIPGAINPNTVKNQLDDNNDIKAVWITNPTYQGVVSDVSEISKLCKSRNIPLIVDEAHGALWNFSDNLPEPAIKLGADASVQSLHKTATALTQGAILHVSKNSLINTEKLQESLNIINSTSPSYVLLSSIEGAVEFLDSQKGKHLLEDHLKNINKLRNTLSNHKNIIVLQETESLKLDNSRIFVGIKGLSGYELSSILMEKYSIEDELCNEQGVLLITGIGTPLKNLKRLEKALIEISKSIKSESFKTNKPESLILPEIVYTPREAFFKHKKEIKAQECLDKISGEIILPYPPGIPVLIPGERIKLEHLKYIQDSIQIIDE